MRFSLKAIRVNANMTQREAAEKLGISRGTLANWEKGKQFPDAKHIAKIEKVYGVNYDRISFLPKNYT